MANRTCSLPGCEGKHKAQGLCMKHYVSRRRSGEPFDPSRTVPRSLPERLWSKFTKAPTGCWAWSGYVDPGGYGRIRLGERSDYSHRVMYELIVEPIPDGLDLDHLCRNRACCNPTHLEPVSHRENMRRSVLARSRVASGTRQSVYPPTPGR